MCIAVFLAGCGGAEGLDKPNDTVTSANSSTQSEPNTDVNSTPVAGNAKDNAYDGVDRTVLGSADKLKTDFKKLPDIESITQAQIDKCMISDGMEVSVTKDSAYKAKGANADIK